MLNPSEAKAVRDLLLTRFSQEGMLEQVVTRAGRDFSLLVRDTTLIPDAIADILADATAKGWSHRLVAAIQEIINETFDENVQQAEGLWLATIQTNLQNQLGRATALQSPFASVFVMADWPYVNRPQVKEAFQALEKSQSARIIVVNGEEGVGKSYSAELLRFVDAVEENAYQVFYKDLSEESTISARKLVEYVLLWWGVNSDIPQQYQQDAGYSNELALLLLGRAPKDKTRWLIIDGMAKIKENQGLLDFLHVLARSVADTSAKVRLILIDFGATTQWRTGVRMVTREVTLQPLTCNDLIDHFFKLLHAARPGAGGFDPDAVRPKAEAAMTNATAMIDGKPRLVSLPDQLRQAAAQLGWIAEGGG